MNHGYRHEFPNTNFTGLPARHILQIQRTAVLMAEFRGLISMFLDDEEKPFVLYCVWLPPMPDDNVTLPIYAFLPPADEVSVLKLVQCVVLVGCITASLGFNAASFVMQIYIRRHSLGFPVQYFITFTFIMSALLPFALPSLILNRLVNLWMFGQHSCNLYFFALTYSRVILPWLIVAIAFHGYLQIAEKRSHFFTIATIFILMVLLVAYVIPEAISTKFSLVVRRERNTSNFIMLVHFSVCVSTFTVNFLQNILIEVVAPMIIMAICTTLTMVNFYWKCQKYDENRKKFLRISILQVSTLLSTYFFNISMYISYEYQQSIQVSTDSSLQDLLTILPFVGTIFYWLPLTYISAYLHELKKAQVQAKQLFTNNMEMSQVRLLHPDDARRLRSSIEISDRHDF